MTMKEPFERVVAAHGPMVLRVCRAVLGVHADADDAWSETFLAALRAYPELLPDANVQAWLVTIAHHKAIDVTRARQRMPLPVAIVPDRASTIGQPGRADPDLWDAVKALPDKQRRCVAYHYLGGLPYDAVAELLGGSAAAARRAAADGIRQLRERYGRTGAEAHDEAQEGAGR